MSCGPNSSCSEYQCVRKDIYIQRDRVVDANEHVLSTSQTAVVFKVVKSSEVKRGSGAKKRKQPVSGRYVHFALVKIRIRVVKTKNSNSHELLLSVQLNNGRCDSIQFQITLFILKGAI